MTEMPDLAEQKEVDEAILDFLVYDAIKALIDTNEEEDRSAKASGSSISDHDQRLDLVDSFIKIFKSKHPGAHCDPSLSLRLRLLKFTVLFTQRQTRSRLKQWGPKLQLIRQQRQKDAESFNGHAGAMGFTQYVGSLSPLEQRKQPNDDQSNSECHGSESENADLPMTSLLDMVPFFMALSATEIALHAGSQITPMWMRLAAGFITQAVIEQCLVYGCRQQEIFDEAFAWGFDPDATFEEGTDGFAVNVMFFDESGEFKEWTKIKQKHMSALMPPPGENLFDHLEKLRSGPLSMDDFKRRMMAFIEGMAQSIPPPYLLSSEI